jgi:RND family efflux transporter MFP subunit
VAKRKDPLVKRWIWVVVAIAVVAAAVWFWNVRQADVRTTASGEGVVVEQLLRGAFEATVSATGSVRAERTQRLAFQTSGNVVGVLAQELDVVKAGQILARLDDADLRLNLAQARAALAVSQAQLARTMAGPSETELAIADAALEIAAVSVQTAQAGVAAARASQQRVLAGPAAQEVAIARGNVEEAKNALWGAQAQRDAVCGRVGVGASQADCDQAESNVNRTAISVTIADLRLEQLQSGTSSADIASAQAQVDQALGQLASARAQLRRATAETELSQQGSSSAEIAIAQAQVDQAQVGVDIAESRLDDVDLVAPADGVVASVSILVGDSVMAGNPVITLIDGQAYHVVLSIDETEIGRIAVGQHARITLDAYPNTPVAGTVSRIGAVGSDVQGIVVFDVRVDIEASDLVLRPYMTSAVSIVVLEAQDALLVPNRAVRRDADGRYVETLSDGQLVRTPIEIGASNSDHSVITAGLVEGDEVVVSRPRDSIFQFPIGAANAD